MSKKNGPSGSQSQALITRESEAVAITDYVGLAEIGELEQVLAENCGDGAGLGIGDLDRVKVPSGGGLAWELPSSGSKPEIAQEIEGVIAYWHDARGRWEQKEGANTPPVCSSWDGRVGVGNPGGDCLSCRYAQFGSAENGRGQACKAMRNFYVLRPEDSLPLRIVAPPSSLKNARDFFLGLGKRSRIIYRHAIIRLGLQRDENPEGKPFSRITFEKVRTLEMEERPAIDAYSQFVQRIIDEARRRNAPIIEPAAAPGAEAAAEPGEERYEGQRGSGGDSDPIEDLSQYGDI